MWTLLKQDREAGKTTIQKCVIACPSSLVGNWANELGWLTMQFLFVFMVTNIFGSEMAWQGCNHPICDRWQSF